jgi:DnaJ-domain-containing protein 1
MQQGSVFGPQTAQAYEKRTGKRVDGLVFGPEPKPAQQPGILESIGNLIMGKQQQQSVSSAIAESQKDQAAQFGEKGIDMYGILGVGSNATDAEIKKAYRKLAIKYHADKQVNKSDSQKAEAAKIMNDVNTAYRVLSDPMTRASFDKNFVKKNQPVFA